MEFFLNFRYLLHAAKYEDDGALVFWIFYLAILYLRENEPNLAELPSYQGDLGLEFGGGGKKVFVDLVVTLGTKSGKLFAHFLSSFIHVFECFFKAIIELFNELRSR